MSEEETKAITTEDSQEAVTEPDLAEFDNALSETLANLYESDFALLKDAAEEEKQIFEQAAKEDGTAFEPVELPSENPTEEEEPEPGDVTEIDDDVFKDINSALAEQIKVEMKKEKILKVLKRPRWWLLSLIPLLGIFVLFIRPLRKYMPRWFMIVRALIFMAFAVCVMGVVASDGELAWYVTARHTIKADGRAVTAVEPLPAKAYRSEDKSMKTLSLLCRVGASGNCTEFILYLDNTEGKLSLIEADEEEFAGMPLDGCIYCEAEGLKVLLTKLNAPSLSEKADAKAIVKALREAEKKNYLMQEVLAAYAAAPYIKTNLTVGQLTEIYNKFGKTEFAEPGR